MDWPHELADQLSWHWEHQLRPRLEGLTDEEYFWEPAPDGWSVRPRGESQARSRPDVARSPSTSPSPNRTRHRSPPSRGGSGM